MIVIKPLCVRKWPFHYLNNYNYIVPLAQESTSFLWKK